MHLTRWFAGLTALALLAAAGPVEPPLHGDYRPDCAPYDGAAFRITLPAPALNGEVSLTANVPLGSMAGDWTHETGSAPGSAMIMLCRKTPEIQCDFPEAGSFTVRGKPGERIDGRIDATFRGKIRRVWRFTANPAPASAGLLCG